MSGHTPGPWQEQAVNPHEYIVWKQGYEAGGAICRVDRQSKYLVGPLKDTAGPDARLIAAAPDLLEAAKAMFDAGVDPIEAEQQLKRAIEKAEGGS